MAEETLFHWPSPSLWRRELSRGDDKVCVVNSEKRGPNLAALTRGSTGQWKR